MRVKYMIEIDWPDSELVRKLKPTELEDYIDNAIQHYHIEIGNAIFDFDDPAVMELKRVEDNKP